MEHRQNGLQPVEEGRNALLLFQPLELVFHLDSKVIMVKKEEPGFENTVCVYTILLLCALRNSFRTF